MSHSAILWLNFNQTKELMIKTGNFEETLLYGRLKFQCGKTKLAPLGFPEIARSRSQLAKITGQGLTATDEHRSSLVSKGLISSRIGMWKGRKRLFISCHGDYDLGLNADKQAMLDRHTGDVKKSALLAYFAYWIDKSPLHYKSGRFKDAPSAMVCRAETARMLGIEPSTVDAYVREFEKKGIIKWQPRRYWAQRQYHVQIEKEFKDMITAEWKEIKIVKKLSKSDKSGASIRINTSLKEDIINNNTSNTSMRDHLPLVNEEGTIILSKKEQNYLGEAVRRTLARCTVLSWGYETLMGHMRYVLTTPKNRNSAQNFVHCINRAMLLVREGKWNQPFGYDKYSFEGVSERARLDGLADEHLCDEGKRRRDENEQRVKQLEERKMYEKDEDEGNVGFQFKMARDVFKGQPSLAATGRETNPAPRKSPITNPIIKTSVQLMAEARANEFASHEDVMAKLLGKA